MNNNLPYFFMQIGKTFDVMREINVNNKLYGTYINIVTEKLLVIRFYNTCTSGSYNKKCYHTV
jgi:hypothetical protein